MLPGAVSLGSVPGGQSDEVRTFWETFPCAISLWSRKLSHRFLNGSAKRLINYSETDFLNRPSLWVDRIHPDDQQKFLLYQERLGKDKSPVHCDYRFFPRNGDRPIWVRDISAFCHNDNKTAWDILSLYIEISDLKVTKTAEFRENPLADAIKVLIHEFQNCIHKINMELDLAGLGLKGKFNYIDFVSTVDTMNRSLEDLRSQLVTIAEHHTSQNPSAILDTIVRKMRKDLNRQRVNVHVLRRGPLPLVQGDNRQLHSAIEQVFQFCGAMLKDGGSLEVESGPKEVDGQVYAEVKLTTHSLVSMEAEREKTLQSFVGIKPDKNELSIDLAREILTRYRGQVSFRKKSNSQSQLTILIKSVSN